MEDSSLDWGEFEDDGGVGKESGFNWVLSKGLNLGKNLAITGVVVSSVPIVVPPLLVISALGFAFSVPFGFMYASYTCTEKLMSKLLPNPSPHMIEYGEGEFVGSEEKGKYQLDYDEIGGFGEGMMIDYQGEMSSENDGVILVNESEEGLTIVREFGTDGKDEEGLQYNDTIRSEKGSSTVNEFGKDEECVKYNDIIMSEEGLSTVNEFGKDEEGLKYNDIIMSEEGLSTVIEFGKDEEGLKYNDIIRSEEGSSTVNEFGKDEEGLLFDNKTRSEEGLSAVSEFRKDKEGVQYEDQTRSEEELSTVGELRKDEEGLLKDDVNMSEEGLNTGTELGKDEEGLQKNNVNTSEEVLSAGAEFGEEEDRSWKKNVNMNEEALSTGTRFGKDGDGLEEVDMDRGETDVNRASGVIMVADELDVPHKEDMRYGGTDDRERPVEEIGAEVNRSGIEDSHENNVNMSEQALSTGTEFGKDEEGLKKDVSMSEEALSTGTEFGKGGDGLEEDDMNRGETNVNRASSVIMVADELDVPYKEDMQCGGTDGRERPVEDMGVEVNRSGIEESRETQATDDAISQVQTIPAVETKATDEEISQAQTIPPVVETSDNKNIREVTHHDLEAKIDTKLGGEKNETHGLKGMDKGKKRHTNAKGKKKTQKTPKRVEGDISKAHEKDVVKPATVSGKADISLESENKLNLDKNEPQFPAPDVAEKKITGVVIISKDNDEPGNLRASIGDNDENNKSTVLPEKPRDQAVSVLVPLLEVSDLKSVPVLVQHEELPELKDDSAQVEGNGLLKNKQEMIGDEEIWKQIDSIRTIVGFKVARHSSYFEELKALYVFTGIEPPSLFNDPLDTSEVCEKLRFLMSVIGVK